MENLKTQLAALLLSTTCLLTGAYGQITPSADAYTNTATPTTNLGTKTLLDVESASQTTYIQFDLSSIPAGYTGADITKAALKLYVNTVTTAGSFNVDYVNGTWAENTITADLAPALGPTIAASVPLTTAEKNHYILIDITPALQAWLSGTANDGIALVGNSPLNATFDSKENTATSHAPELDIVFAGGGTLTGVTTASSSGLTGGGTSGTLNLGLLTTCASGQVLKWNGSGWACATASGTGTVTSVGSGAGLTGGPITGAGTLSLDTTKVPLLAAANTFTANQVVNGSVTATMSSTGSSLVGNATATTGSTTGVYGTVASPIGYGVQGIATATTGAAVGVSGSTAAPLGNAVQGIATSTAVGITGANGVYGLSYSPVGYGVQGFSNTNVGVYGSTGGSGYGVEGVASASGSIGVFGTGPIGVKGTAASGGLSGLFQGGPFKVTGNGNNLLIGDPGCGSGFAAVGFLPSGSMSGCSNYAILGDSAGGTYINTSGTAITHFRSNNNELVTIDNSGNVNVIGQNGGGNLTVAGQASIVGNLTVAGQVLTSNQNINGNQSINGFLSVYGGTGTGAAVDVFNNGTGGGSGISASGQYGTVGHGGDFYGGYDGSNYGGLGASFHGGTSGQWGGDGIAATPGSGTSAGGPGYAGIFYGNIDVTGSAASSADDLKIDHPLDPSNQYLLHSSVESSEMMNIYTGNVTTDSQGLATVQLPDWFEALNTDFRYQLTVIGQFAQAIVASEIGHNQFGIRTDKPNVKVSWQVTGVRQDAYAKANPLVVEQAKDARERGYYIHPELYGASEQQSIEWARHPEMMKGMQEIRARQLAASPKQAAPRN